MSNSPNLRTCSELLKQWYQSRYCCILRARETCWSSPGGKFKALQQGLLQNTTGIFLSKIIPFSNTSVDKVNTLGYMGFCQLNPTEICPHTKFSLCSISQGNFAGWGSPQLREHSSSGSRRSSCCVAHHNIAAFVMPQEDLWQRITRSARASHLQDWAFVYHSKTQCSCNKGLINRKQKAPHCYACFINGIQIGRQ